MSLPLVIRKNIRDNDPKLQENLQAINAATGREWSLDVDWAANVAQIPEQGQKDSIGAIYQSDAMGYLKNNIVKFCKNETSKEAFNEAASSAKITFKVDPKLPGYWAVSFANGDLVVSHKPSIANLSTIENFDIVAAIPSAGGLSLAVRLNLEKYQAKMQENLEKIAQATGVSDWTCEADFSAIIPQLTDKKQGEDIGNYYYDQVLFYFANNLTKNLKNEILKEAFNEATSEHKIEFRLNEKINGWWDVAFENGAVIIYHKKSLSNLNSIEYINIAPKIPTPGGIPLVTRINLNSEKNQEHLQKYLERINKATGLDDWSFEADYATICPLLEKNSQDTLGDIYYQNALDYFTRNVDKKCQSSTIREAFNEAASNHKIVFRVNDKITGWWTIKFENGNVVVEHKKSISNINSLEHFALEEAIPTPGLSLPIRLNIEKFTPKMEEHLQKIAEVTGAGEWTFEADYDTIIPQLSDKGQANQIGSLYFDNALHYISKNIQKKMASETIKEAFNEAASNRKIIFRVNDKINGWWTIKFENGDVVVEHKKSLSNINNLEYFALEEAIPSPGLPLPVKLNIEKFRPKMEENLQKISDATGAGDWTFEAEFETIVPLLADKGQQTSIGSLYFDNALDYLARNIKKACAVETTKEAFNEATSQRKVVIQLNEKQAKWWEIAFKDGALVVTHKKSLSNLNELEYYPITSIIPSPGILSLVSKLSLETNREKLEGYLQVISEASGNHFTFDDSCLETIYPKLSQSNKDGLGRVVYDDIICYLSRNIKKRLADEMVKEAFNERAHAHTITLQHKPAPLPARGYWNISFSDDGKVVLTFSDITNLSEIEHFNFENLL